MKEYINFICQHWKCYEIKKVIDDENKRLNDINFPTHLIYKNVSYDILITKHFTKYKIVFCKVVTPYHEYTYLDKDITANSLDKLIEEFNFYKDSIQYL